MLQWLVVVLVACDGRVAPHRPLPAPTPLPPMWCPEFSGQFSELFGCADLPLGDIACGRMGCELPCGAVAEHDNEQDEFIYEYDAEGHYTRTLTNGEETEVCAYERGKRVSCKSRVGTLAVERDANGRIIKLHHDQPSFDEKTQQHVPRQWSDYVSYDSKGRVVSIGGSPYAYDKDGQLVTSGGRHLDWKDRYHVEAEVFGNQLSAFYDETGRVVRIVCLNLQIERRLDWNGRRLVRMQQLRLGITQKAVTYRYCR